MSQNPQLWKSWKIGAYLQSTPAFSYGVIDVQSFQDFKLENQLIPFLDGTVPIYLADSK